MLGARFVTPQAGEFVVDDAPRQALRRLPQQVRGSAAQDHVSRGVVGVVQQDAKNRKEIGPRLDLVQHDQAAQGTQRQLRLGQAGQMLGVLQVEPGDRSRMSLRHLACQGGLAHLAGAEDGDRRMLVEVPQ